MWIDLEMTDISNVSAGRIMEVGVIFTGSAFELLDEGEEEGPPRSLPSMYHRVVKCSAEELAGCSAWSKSVHGCVRPRIGMSLLDLCLSSPFELEQVEEDLIRLVTFHSGSQPIMLAGSSIACDRVFIDYHMPRLSALLHHRMIDVSTVLEMTRRMYPGYRPHVPRLRRVATTSHSAMADIIASLRLMHELQNSVFMPMLFAPHSYHQHRGPQYHYQQPRAAHHNPLGDYGVDYGAGMYRQVSSYPPPPPPLHPGSVHHHLHADPGHSSSSADLGNRTAAIVRQSYRFPAHIFERYLGYAEPTPETSSYPNGSHHANYGYPM
jgi:oligoribonuclease